MDPDENPLKAQRRSEPHTLSACSHKELPVEVLPRNCVDPTQEIAGSVKGVEEFAPKLRIRVLRANSKADVASKITSPLLSRNGASTASRTSKEMQTVCTAMRHSLKLQSGGKMSASPAKNGLEQPGTPPSSDRRAEPSSDLLELPDHVLLKIVCKLGHQDVSPVGKVCSQMYHVVKEAKLNHFSYNTPVAQSGAQDAMPIIRTPRHVSRGKDASGSNSSPQMPSERLKPDQKRPAAARCITSLAPRFSKLKQSSADDSFLF